MGEIIEIFTDGSARGNPGPGGYGALLRCGAHSKELSAGYLNTTNNRMELLGVIVALEALKKPHLKVLVTSDSKYVTEAVSKGWVFTWAQKRWATRPNSDLWRRFLQIYRQHDVTFRWIKGHAGFPENERCDALATAAADAAAANPAHALKDEGYQGALNDQSDLFKENE